MDQPIRCRKLVDHAIRERKVVDHTMSGRGLVDQSHTLTLMIYKLGFNQSYYTLTLISLTNSVLGGKFSWTKCKCFDMQSHLFALGQHLVLRDPARVQPPSLGITLYVHGGGWTTIISQNVLSSWS